VSSAGYSVALPVSGMVVGAPSALLVTARGVVSEMTRARTVVPPTAGRRSRAGRSGPRQAGSSSKAIAPSATVAIPIVCSGARRRSVGDPGLKI
jgi:hypothetical protein